MSDVERKWMPHDYQDEVVPPARKTPSAWITKLDDGAPALAAGDCYGDEDEPGRKLTEGEVVLFDWTEDHGRFDLTFRDTDDGWVWTLDGDEPTASPGSSMNVAEVGDWETMMPSLAEFVAEYDRSDGETITVIFYAWSDVPEAYEFRDGAFRPADGSAA